MRGKLTKEILLQLGAVLLAATIWMPVFAAVYVYMSSPSWICIDIGGATYCLDDEIYFPEE